MADCHQKGEESREVFYPQPWKDQGSTEACSQIADLHKPQTTYFCCFKSFSLWYAVTAMLGN